ncbi:hypothetical protein F4825DRAFT_456767 [Nemania diffusa]|nr:hypothetical protein F4825DRAFT_456767 [Nemania diffusa]
MAAVRDPAGKERRQHWAAKLGIGHMLSRLPREMREIFRGFGSRKDKNARAADRNGACRHVCYTASQFISHKIISEDSSPTTSRCDSAFSPTASELDISDRSQEMERRSFPRTPSKSFPRSKKEEEKDPVDSSSIDSRIRDTETKPGRLHPEPEDQQEAHNQARQKLQEKQIFDAQLEELKTAMRTAQAGNDTMQASQRFVEIWEAQLLPRIEQVLDASVEGEYTVNVARGADPGTRTIVVMTANAVPSTVEQQIQDARAALLPGDLDASTTLMFRQGAVQFLTNPSPSVPSSSAEDPCTSPRNKAWHPDPAIGDSVGWGESSATLGPTLQVDSRFYRLVSWHLFDDKGPNRACAALRPPRGLSTVHPSPRDSQGGRTPMGDVAAYSGRMHLTSRPASSIPAAHVVTDWALLECPEGIPKPNIVRRRARGDLDTPSPSPFSSSPSSSSSIHAHADTIEREITRSTDPGSFLRQCSASGLDPLVYAVGRTSGYATGLLGLSHGVYRLPDGRKTKNWTVDDAGGKPHGAASAREWIRGGMGVPGDSGAGVFGFYGDELLGQVWGRNTYAKDSPEPRIVFFTAMDDIYADIAERMPGRAANAAAPVVQLPTRQSIKEAVGLGREQHAAHNAMLSGIDDRCLLDPISEVLDDADLEDDTDQGQGQVSRHRSSATSRRLGAFVALGRRASVFEPLACPPLQKWAKVVIHASTI